MIRYRYKHVSCSLLALIGQCVAQLLAISTNSLKSAFSLINPLHQIGNNVLCGKAEHHIPSTPAHEPHYIAIYGLSGSHMLLHLILKTARY